MEQQKFFKDSVHVCERRPTVGKIIEYVLSKPSLKILGFKGRTNGALFHLYRLDAALGWTHVDQADTLTGIISKAQVA